MRRDWPDIWGGLTLAALGLGAAVWAGLHYDLGTLRRMGPGMFPVLLGAALCLFGLIVALPALRRQAEATRVELAPVFYVLLAILIFGLGVQRLGLVAVTFAAALTATVPARRSGWRWRGVLALAITLLTVAVFHFGLRMTLPLWPRLT